SPALVFASVVVFSRPASCSRSVLHPVIRIAAAQDRTRAVPRGQALCVRYSRVDAGAGVMADRMRRFIPTSQYGSVIGLPRDQSRRTVCSLASYYAAATEQGKTNLCL